jgi:hypothetical protein
MAPAACCDRCGALMVESVGCRADLVIRVGRRRFEPVLYGLEDVFLESGPGGEWWEPGACHDCAAGPYGAHHDGCSVERCPACGGQLLGCGCGPRWVRRRWWRSGR